MTLAKVQALVEHWRTTYDWRRGEQALREMGQFRGLVRQTTPPPPPPAAEVPAADG